MRPPIAEGWTVAYLTKRFPRLSETFILDEILGLEQAGVPLRLYSCADPHESFAQPDVARVASPVSYLREDGARARMARVLETVAAHARLLAADPVRYRRALAHLVRHPDRRTTIGHFATAGRLALRLRRDRARQLHAAFAHTPASIAHYTHLLSGVPFSFAGHAKDLYTSHPVALAARATAAEFVLVCSQSAARELTLRAGPDARIVLAYHGVDSERFKPRPRCVQDHEPVSLLAVGRLVEKKGYPVLLDALALLSTRREIRCEIIGDGEKDAELREQIDRLELGHIVALTGARTHQQTAEAYGRADVFIQASVVLGNGDRDGVPNSLLEAMASGLAVVASDVAGIPEVIHHEVNGLMVAPGSAEALAFALGALVDDCDLRQRLGTAARDHIMARLDRHTCSLKLVPLFGAHDSAWVAPAGDRHGPSELEATAQPVR